MGDSTKTKTVPKRHCPQAKPISLRGCLKSFRVSSGKKNKKSNAQVIFINAVFNVRSVLFSRLGPGLPKCQ